MTREEFLKEVEGIGLVDFTFDGIDVTLFFKNGSKLDIVTWEDTDSCRNTRGYSTDFEFYPKGNGDQMINYEEDHGYD